MIPIRPAERQDLPAVARLFERVLPGRSALPPPDLGRFFERTLLDYPWADPEIPSLVYTDGDGHLIGFIASQVRRMRFDGRPVRLVASSHLMAAPDTQAPVGALLMRKCLAGAQDLTVTDTATELVRRMWTGMGGQSLHLGGIEWVRVFRPGRVAAGLLAQRPGRARAAAAAASSALDPLLERAVRPLLRPDGAEASVEPLTPRAVLEQLPALTEPLRLVPDYDEPYLQWLFAELARQRPDGQVVGSLVLVGGRVAGWYVYLLRRGGPSRVLQLVARDEDTGVVLDHLLEHAAGEGAAAVRGRVEPQLFDALRERRCLLRNIGGTLIYSADSELIGAIAAGSGLLALLDGEWLGLPPEPASD